ncbi:MAG: hypothetical protein HC874_14185 [Richelia sp. SL_2_1]|nr:hypothetical protein [Richelia sp. SL_2_1]
MELENKIIVQQIGEGESAYFRLIYLSGNFGIFLNLEAAEQGKKDLINSIRANARKVQKSEYVPKDKSNSK